MFDCLLKISILSPCCFPAPIRCYDPKQNTTLAETAEILCTALMKVAKASSSSLGFKPNQKYRDTLKVCAFFLRYYTDTATKALKMKKARAAKAAAVATKKTKKKKNKTRTSDLEECEVAHCWKPAKNLMCLMTHRDMCCYCPTRESISPFKKSCAVLNRSLLSRNVWIRSVCDDSLSVGGGLGGYPFHVWYW